jgi:preprotein translocase subunit SecF
MEAHEAFERFETAHHGAEGEGFASQAAVLVAILAAFLAVATFKANEAVKDAIQTQTKIADTHANLQTQVSHQIELELAYAQLNATSAALPNSAATAIQKAAKQLDTASNQLDPEIEKLKETAKEQSKETNDSNHSHLIFELAEVGLQIGIVLASVSIVARRRWLLGAGGLAGAAGVVILIVGFLA